jgi:hypothetical protein
MKNLQRKIVVALLILINATAFASNNEIEELATRIANHSSFNKYCLNLTGLNIIRMTKLSTLTESEQKDNINKVENLVSKFDLLDDNAKQELAFKAGFNSVEDFILLKNNIDLNFAKVTENFPQLKSLNSENIEVVFGLASSKWSTFMEANSEELIKCLDAAKQTQHRCNGHHKTVKMLIWGLGSLTCVGAAVIAAVATGGSASQAAFAAGGLCVAAVVAFGATNDSGSSNCVSKYQAAQTDCIARWGGN